MRGGQVTLFVAIGLVLLLTVGLFYVVITANQQDLQDEDIQSTTNVGVLANYLQSCLDTIIYDELDTIGRQGGALSFSTIPSATIGSGDTERTIAFGITRNKQNSGILPRAYDPPRYPDTRIAVGEEEQGLADWQDGYFGDVWLPAPCSKTSANRPGSTFTCRYYPGNPPGTIGPSMQELLEERVRQRVQGCADLRAFEEATGQDIEKVDEPSVNITLTYDNMIVVLRYPLQLHGSTTTRFEEFTQRYRVRLLPMMQFALDLAKEESRNVTFNISGDYEDIPSWKPGFIVENSRNVALGQIVSGRVDSPSADLVTITDTVSVVEGSSFTFSFLIEDRMPMLDHITQQDWGECNYFPSRWLAWDPDEGPVEVSQGCVDGQVVNYTATDEESAIDYQLR